MILAAALASATIALSGPAVAPPTVQADLGAAAAYWQQPIPPQCTSTTVSSVTTLPSRVLGEATESEPNVVGPCTMVIARGMDPRLRCLVVAHEYGHWLGFAHSADRHNPMFPVIDPTMVVLPQCERS
jgi:hypothetical protein